MSSTCFNNVNDRPDNRTLSASSLARRPHCCAFHAHERADEHGHTSRVLSRQRAVVHDLIALSARTAPNSLDLSSLVRRKRCDHLR